MPVHKPADGSVIGKLPSILISLDAIPTYTVFFVRASCVVHGSRRAEGCRWRPRSIQGMKQLHVFITLCSPLSMLAGSGVGMHILSAHTLLVRRNGVR